MRISEIISEGSPFRNPEVVYDQAWHNRREALHKRLQAFAEPIKKELGLKFFTLYAGRVEGENGFDIELDLIVADQKSTGAGSEAMRRLCAFADENGLRIILKVADRSSGKNYGTTSRARLVNFYHRFGFKMNTGANHDKWIKYFQMYRNPVSS